MLNRRHLRVKVLQSLYAFFQSGSKDLVKGEKQLLFGIEKIYDLYLYQMMLLPELLNMAELIIEEKRGKKLPDPEDINPNKRFVENKMLRLISENENLRNASKNNKISWNNHQELIRKLLRKIQSSKYYSDYLVQENSGFEKDRGFVINIFINEACNFELLHSFYEETCIYWLDDWEMVNKMLVKTMKTFSADSQNNMLMGLYKDPEDKKFGMELFKRTVINSEEFAPLISKRTQNWDIERIALMDIIIMKMALTEILKFPEIPVKVSLNEYIELAKMYSTPKSKIFINGVLDKLVEELFEKKEINKYTK